MIKHHLDRKSRGGAVRRLEDTGTWLVHHKAGALEPRNVAFPSCADGSQSLNLPEAQSYHLCNGMPPCVTDVRIRDGARHVLSRVWHVVRYAAEAHSNASGR